jgi:error-prone DNA polymerase
MRYAELQTTTNFSFLRGASHPQEMVLTAEALGLAGIGIADRNTLAGVVRGWSEARKHNYPYKVGCRLDFMDGRPSVLCYPQDREAYGRLTRLLTLGKTRAKKGECQIGWADLFAHGEGQVLILVPPAVLDKTFERDLGDLAATFPGQVYLAASRAYAARDLKRLHHLNQAAIRAGAPMVATNDVLYHDVGRRPLQDVLSCVREKCTIQQAGLRLEAHAERHLKSPAEMARLFKDYPDALYRTVEILERCQFQLSDLKYEYPHEPVPPGKTAIQHLREITLLGAEWRYSREVPEKVRDLLEAEFRLIEEMNYPHYFLTVHDIVRFARHRGILCQGRGSAANSSVCYCLGVTAVDPGVHDLLFARFISTERGEPPDIDVDFEHERREEVMQYVFDRYGRDRAAICATVIHYRPRSAIRDVGKALGLTEDVTSRLADTVWGSWGDGLPDAHILQAGLDPTNPEILRAVGLATQILQFPRHLSQHVGGFVLTERRLDETVPIGNAAMADRTFIEWDKDDIDEVGLMKVDVLALGMLTALKRGFDMLAEKGVHIGDVAEVPADDPEVYEMLSHADSVGVFQVESRAQMSMLPRLRPKVFYDLVIEVAIVRPGPIQGDMVHPYLRRRDGIEEADYPSPAPEHGPKNELENVLGKTLGVPLFQEQAMRLAIEAARFTPAEANGLRRTMATFRNLGDVSTYRDKFVGGMTRRGYDADFATRCFKQIEGFGSYGFPESHAVSFANLVYASAWIKCHHPEVFCAALLNSQPMGFYQPAQLVRDARDHGVEVRGADVMWSGWDNRLEAAQPPPPPSVVPLPHEGGGGRKSKSLSSSPLVGEGDRGTRWRGDQALLPLRLGLRQVRGVDEKDAKTLVAARDVGARSLHDFAVAGVTPAVLERLAQADAFRSLGMDRRQALWAVKGLEPAAAAKPESAPLLVLMGVTPEPDVALPRMPLPEHVLEDYRTAGLSLKAHPVSFFREALNARQVVTSAGLQDRRLKNGRRIAIAGLVLIRQRPGTAKGVCFLTLEDETGASNIVVWRDRFEANRKLVMTASFLLVRGKLERAGEVIHVSADEFYDLSSALSRLREEGAQPRMRSQQNGRLLRSRDFH